MTKSPGPAVQNPPGFGCCGIILASVLFGVVMASCTASGSSTPSVYDRFDQDDYACSRAIDALGRDDGTTELERLEVCDRVNP